MGPWPVLLVAALVPAVALGAGPHRLQYELTETQNASLYSQFIAKEYLDGQLILRYDSENSSAETRGLLARVVLGAEPGDAVTTGFTEDRRGLWRKLVDIREKQSQNGVAWSLQEVRGCEIQEDNTTRAFRRFFYNGEPFLFYNETTHEWEAPQSPVLPLAMEVKKSWDADRIGNQNSWALVNGNICGKLRRYRESWKAFTKRTAVNATCSQASEGGEVNVTCWASGFSPWNISLVWLQDHEPLSPPAQLPGGVPCDENGIYWAWVALRIPQGEEQRVTCSVEHYWNCTVTCGNVQVHRRPRPAASWGIVAGVVAVLVAAVLLYNFWLRKTSAGERSGPFRGEVLSQVVTTDLHGPGPHGSRPLLSAPESRDSTGGA